MSLIQAESLERLLKDILIKHNTSEENARCVASALVAADVDGLHSHGAARIYAYAKQAQNGKVDGYAKPVLTRPASSVVKVDAAGGFAYPAINKGLSAAAENLDQTGIAVLNIGQSHHSGAIGQFIEPLARRGYVVMAFSNSTSAIAPAGGIRPLFGTNPIAFSCPRENTDPLLIDLSLSKVARGKIKLASDAGEKIPLGWAINTQGEPTSNAQEALDGALLPIGDSKGAALAMMLELLCAGLSGSNFGYQAGSFFTEKGPQPRIGQFFLLINPATFNPNFVGQAEQLFMEVLSQPGTRLPGSNRLERRRQSLTNGIALDPRVLAQLHSLNAT